MIQFYFSAWNYVAHFITELTTVPPLPKMFNLPLYDLGLEVGRKTLDDAKQVKRQTDKKSCTCSKLFNFQWQSFFFWTDFKEQQLGNLTKYKLIQNWPIMFFVLISKMETVQVFSVAKLAVVHKHKTLFNAKILPLLFNYSILQQIINNQLSPFLFLKHYCVADNLEYLYPQSSTMTGMKWFSTFEGEYTWEQHI